MSEKTYLEIYISKVYKPGRTGHDPKKMRLALYRFEDLSKFEEIMKLLNSMSENKVGFERLLESYPELRSRKDQGERGPP